MSKRAALDLAERAGATFAQAFLALEVVDQTKLTQIDALKAAAVAGVFAVAKFALAKVSVYLNTPEPKDEPEPKTLPAPPPEAA